MSDHPNPRSIRDTRARLGERILTTPVRLWRDESLDRAIGSGTRVYLKEELFQRTGSFKPRGVLAFMLDLDAAALGRGVTAFSAGNHAMAVGYAARSLGCSAKVVMPHGADPFRIAACRELGVELELVESVHAAAERVKRIERDEERVFVHPFEGPAIARGTATLGLEICEQIEDLDAVVVAIGGGGLCGGVAAAVKQMRPACRVYGVEPTGADSMHRSFAAGSPQAIERVQTIADSLGAPRAEPYSFDLCRRFVDDVVLVEDAAIRDAMRRMYASAKLAVEPAGATAAAALFGPLRERLAAKSVCLVVCGANIDAASFGAHVALVD